MIPPELSQWLKLSSDLEPRRLWELYRAACNKKTGKALHLALDEAGLGEYLEAASHEASERQQRHKRYVNEGAEHKIGTIEHKLKNKDWRSLSGRQLIRESLDLADESAAEYALQQTTQNPAFDGVKVWANP